MRISKLLLTLSLTGVSSAIAARDDVPQADNPLQLTNQFIIEVTPGTDVDALSTKLASQRGARVVKTFKSDVFTGLAIETDFDNSDSLQAEAEVAQAWPASKIWLDPLQPSAQYSGSSDFPASNYSVHKWTGVDQAHEAGILGKGAKVAIVDTGIDYNHPALGGGFGPGYKIAGGYDLVGDLYWPSFGQKTPDNDPMDEIGHGTHVAGIVAGKNDWFTGVAPEAEIYIYKVFTSVSGTDEPTLIDAFLRAYEEGADIITSSVGGASGFANGPWATVASRIADQGVVVTISAANDGQHGPFYPSSGSSGKNVLAIASAEAGTLPSAPFELTFSLDSVANATTAGYLTNRDPWDLKDWPIYPLSFDTTDPAQACSDIPTGTPDLSNVITLVRKGGCEILQKEANLAPFNVTHVMFYNDNEEPVEPWSWLADRPKALVDAAVGEAIIDTVKAGGNVTADFTKFTDPNYYVGMYNAAGNRPNYFTSWGGLFDLTLKPDVAAPGGEILSTYPDDTWAVLSGTSMSCPYVAGVAALYVGQYGGRKVHGPGFSKLLANRIISSGAAIPWSTADSGTPVDTGFWAPTIQAGSGLINAWKVLNYTTGLTFEKFHLNDTHHFSRYHSVDITNNANTPVVYNFTLQPAAGIEANATGAQTISTLTDLKPLSLIPSVKFPSSSFKLQPGQTKTAEFTFDYPKGAVEDNQPLYSGKVLISSSIGEELSVPYFGAAYNLKGQYDSLFQQGSVFARSPSLDIFQKSNFTFDTSTKGPTAQDYIKLFASFKFGCSELRWDIFEPGFQERNWKYPPEVGQNGYVGSVAMWRLSETYSYFDPTTQDKDDTVSFPIQTVIRNSPISYTRHAFFWLGKLANGTYITPGNYSMRFAALRPFGTPEHSDNWDIWKTPDITVLPLPAV